MPVPLKPLAALLAVLVVIVARAAEPVDYSRDVLPILSANCFKCHGRDSSTRKAKLRLDLREHATATLKDGAIPVDPGHASESELIARIASTDEDERMPPADKGRALYPAEIETLRTWITQGAAYNEHWAYLPLATSTPATPPPSTRTSSAENPIDRFVLARLVSEKLTPAPHAARAALIRRASLDLTGLLPTPAEIDAFVSARVSDAEAFSGLTDRLLASPHYGERYGRHWLDVARYADSGGFETDIFFGHAWRYRDYVIRAFNADKPFDLFIKEQIAGDELFPGNAEARVATGLYTTGPVLQEAGMVTGKLEYDQNTDFADTTGSAFLGLTVGCARCHDHKYDPISQKEYYSLQAIFAASDQMDFTADGTKIRDRAALKRTDKEFEADQARDRTRREKDPVKRAALLRKVGDAFIENDATLKARVDATRRYNTIARAIADYQQAAAGQPLDPMHADPLESDVDDSNDTVALKALLLSLRTGLKAQPADVALMNVGIVAYLNPPPRGARAQQQRRPAAASPTASPADLPASTVASNSSPPPPAPSAEPRPPTGAKVSTVALQPPSNAFNTRRTFTALKTDAEKRDFLLAFGRDQIASLEKPANYLEDVDALRLEAGEKHLGDPSPIPNRVLAHKDVVPEWRVLNRGELDQPLDVVAPGLPERLAVGFSLAGVPADHRRAALAEWIASDKNLLTARVIANRVWQWHFGEGLVRTPNDLGVRGDHPSHPALLNWLATELISHHWSLKHLHRVIMASATYQQAATASAATLDRDPDNRLLTRFQPHRLEAEIVWDNIRAASGTLDLTMFGLPIAPPLDDQEQLGNYRKWPASTPEEANRRAIYILVKRSFRFPMLSAFDLPDNITSCGRRDITTIPNQALTLLNNRTMREQAAAFADRLLRETHGQVAAAPALAWRYAYARDITSAEHTDATAFLVARGAAKSALTELCLALFNTNEFIYQQ